MSKLHFGPRLCWVVVRSVVFIVNCRACYRPRCLFVLSLFLSTAVALPVVCVCLDQTSLGCLQHHVLPHGHRLSPRSPVPLWGGRALRGKESIYLPYSHLSRSFFPDFAVHDRTMSFTFRAFCWVASACCLLLHLAAVSRHVPNLSIHTRDHPSRLIP